MAGFEWSPTMPFVSAGAGEDGWCVRDAFCLLFGWERGSGEWLRFVENPVGLDMPRLAEHLGLTVFRIPEDWNSLIARLAHPAIAVFAFDAFEISHAVYVSDVRWLLHHWPRPEQPPAAPDERQLFWYGWPLHHGYLARGPVLDAVLLDERQPPRPCERRIVEVRFNV